MIASALLSASLVAPDPAQFFAMDWRLGERQYFAVSERVMEPSGEKRRDTKQVLERVYPPDGENGLWLRYVVQGPDEAEDRRLRYATAGQMLNNDPEPEVWFRLPLERIKPGERYVAFDMKYRTPFGTGERTSVVIFRGVDVMAGRRVANFALRSTLKGKTYSGSGSGQVHIEADTGRMISQVFNYVLAVKENGETRTVPVRLQVNRTWR